MEFLNIYAFLLLLLIPLFFIIKSYSLPFKKEIIEKITLKTSFSKKKRFFLYLIGYLFFVIALARPVIDKGFETINLPKKDIVILLDASKPMKCNDIYPNRFEAAKEKIAKLFKKLKFENVSIIIVDKNPYLLNPPSNDYNSIIYLLNHVDTSTLFQSFSSNLNKVNIKSNKIVIAFSYVPYKKGIFYNISLKPCLGFFSNKGIKFTYSDDDINQIASIIKKENSNKTIKIKQKTELFYYFLIIGLILVFFATFWRGR